MPLYLSIIEAQVTKGKFKNEKEKKKEPGKWWLHTFELTHTSFYKPYVQTQSSHLEHLGGSEKTMTLKTRKSGPGVYSEAEI